MPFIKVPGLKGLLYVPATNDDAPKKHACNDCYSCQLCADSRCKVCMGGQAETDGCKNTKK